MRTNVLHSRILYSLLAVMMATALVPLISVSWGLIVEIRDGMSANARSEQLQRTRADARNVSDFVVGAMDQTSALARALELGPAMPDRADSGGLTEVLRRNPDLLAVAIVPVATGASMTQAVRNDSSDVHEAIDAAVSGAGERGRFLDRIRTLGPHRVPAVATADAVTINGSRVAYVVAVVDLTGALQQIGADAAARPLGEMLATADTATFLVDQGGSVVEPSSSATTDAPHMRLDDPAVAEWVSSGGHEQDATKVFERTIAGTRTPILATLAAVHLPDDRRLAVVTISNQAVALAPANRLATKALWAGVFAAFVTMLAAYLFAGQIATPIRDLARGAREIASGNFSHRIRVRSHNETGVLAEDFNLMADRLEDHVEKLRVAAETNRALFIGTVRALAAAIDGKDPYTRGHSERVADYSAAMAIELGLPDEEVEKIRIGGLMHDLGKLAIEDKILRKPAQLTDEEFEIMREHPERGTKIMSQIPQMREFIPGMRFHHEMMNGKGYPLGLHGDQIPMMARIVGVADTFDAMTTNRPYQKQMPIDVVFERIRSFSGVRYDPAVVDALVAAYEHGRIKLKNQRNPTGRPAAEEPAGEPVAR